MNDLIVMAIKGGRYLEAEQSLNQIILSQPNSEAYFLLATVKSNLLLANGRSFDEITYCFEKSISLSDDRTQTQNDTGAFLYGIVKQLNIIHSTLKTQAGNQLLKSLAGIALTFASSKIIDNSDKAFGIITGAVGAGFGVGMTIDGLNQIGDIANQIEFVKNLQRNTINYLKNYFPELANNFKTNIEWEKIKSLENIYPDFIYTKSDFLKVYSKLKSAEILEKIDPDKLIFVANEGEVIFYSDKIQSISSSFLMTSLTEYDIDDLEGFSIDMLNEKCIKLKFSKETTYYKSGNVENNTLNVTLRVTFKGTKNIFKIGKLKEVYKEFCSALNVADSKS
jgi:hypothetical protein